MLKPLFEDNHLIVFNKPANLQTQEGEEANKSLEAIGKAYIKEAMAKPGNVYLHAIHRLDTPVSGVVVFARTSKALSRMQEQIREKRVEKTYLALVEGDVLEGEGTLEHYLIHGEHKAIFAKKGEPDAKRCLLSYRVLKKGAKYTLLEIELVTGRYHQIRAQLSLFNHPIVGDRKYGSKFPFSGEGIALHHAKFECTHPTTKESLCFEAPLPEQFLEALAS